MSDIKVLGFGLSDYKKEGETVQYDDKAPSIKNLRPTAWVERKVPLEYADTVHNMITQFLKAKGIDDDSCK